MAISSLANRVLFFGAGLLFLVAVVEKVANVSGYTLTGQAFEPWRLLEFSAIMVLFVVALLLREIRERLGARN